MKIRDLFIYRGTSTSRADAVLLAAQSRVGNWDAQHREGGGAGNGPLVVIHPYAVMLC